MNRRNVLRVSAGIMGILGSAGAALAGQLPDCNINFDGLCPDDFAICGASFSGGDSCAFEGLVFCYSSGLFSYKITPGFPLTITLSADLISLDVFFMAQGALSLGEMRFFDAEVGGNEVGAPLSTNGDCDLIMEETQIVAFDTPVRRIEVTATGGAIWIDDFRTNPPTCGDCPTDGPISGPDGVVGSADLAWVLGNWGAFVDNPLCQDEKGNFVGCPADLVCLDELEPQASNQDVGPEEIAKITGSWGPCPG